MPSQGWAVEFRGPDTEIRCYAGWSSLKGPLRSETTPACIALWDTEAEVREWMAAQGLGDGRPVPIGGCWLHSTAVPLDLADLEPRPWWLVGALFEVRMELHAAAEPARERVSVPCPRNDHEATQEAHPSPPPPVVAPLTPLPAPPEVSERGIAVYQEGHELTFTPSGPKLDPVFIATAPEGWRLGTDGIRLPGRREPFGPSAIVMGAEAGWFGLGVHLDRRGIAATSAATKGRRKAARSKAC